MNCFLFLFLFYFSPHFFKMNFPIRSTPVRLCNINNVCSINCIIQVLFNDADCWQMINQLNDNDILKQLAVRYSTITNGNRSINMEDLYETFQPVIDTKNEEKLMHPDENIRGIQIDPMHLFQNILSRYNFLNEYFKNSEEETNFSQIISISDDSVDVQVGLDCRIYQNLNEFPYAPKCLCINVIRVLPNALVSSRNNANTNALYISKKPITPNRYIHYAPFGSDIDEYYKLYSIIIHRNNEINRGHFEVLLFINDKFYHCNDNHVTPYLKNEISDSTLEKKNYIFFYQKLERKPEDFENQTQISPPRKRKFAEIENSFSSNESISQNSSIINSFPNRNGNELFPVTDLNTKTIPLFIPYDIQADGNSIPEEIHIDDESLNMFKLVEKTQNNAIKYDIHKNFKYLNGFLDIAPGESPANEYSTSKPIYLYTQKILEVFTEILCNLIYKSDSTSNGEINANLTANQLNIDFESHLNLQVKEVGEQLYNLFKDYENRNLKIVKEKIEGEIVEIIKDMIAYHFDEEDKIIPEHKKNNSNKLSDIDFPDENYDWQSRIDEYGIERILDEMKKKNYKNENEKLTATRDKVREKLWNDFLAKKSEIKSKRKFTIDWVKSRTAAVNEGAKYISEKRAYQILNDYIKNKDKQVSKKQVGAPSKFNDEARLCLLATVMDFPSLTDEQRTDYLNHFGPCKYNNVSTRLVNKELLELNITIKKPCFSEPQRNSIGFRIARYIWAKIMLNITEQRNALFVFIDEAGVQRSQPNSSRGYVSVRPLSEGTTKSSNIASILTAVIPGYGSISRWYKGPVTNKEYAIFLREISYILKTKICNASTQIIIIQDNASIHKTKEVREMALKCNFNSFFIVPYSPHLNEVAENYFSQLKHACIFDREFSCRSENADGINGNTKFQFLDEEEIMYRWNQLTKQKYSGISALSIFQGWISILNDCVNGKPLTGQKFTRSEVPNLHLNNIQCYRKNIFHHQ